MSGALYNAEAVMRYAFSRIQGGYSKSAGGAQYVHCVMHKCIRVKVGGNENT